MNDKDKADSNMQSTIGGSKRKRQRRGARSVKVVLALERIPRPEGPADGRAERLRVPRDYVDLGQAVGSGKRRPCNAKAQQPIYSLNVCGSVLQHASRVNSEY